MSTVTTKRSTRITFLGCCNLPQQKAIALRDSLQSIISHLSDLHAACDDVKITVHDKHKKLHDLAVLSKDVDVLLEMDKAQVDLCASEADIHSQLQSLYSQISSNVDKATGIFKRLSGDVLHKGIEQDAVQLVDILLALVRDTVELLKVADKYTITKIEKQNHEFNSYAQSLTDATPDELEGDVGENFVKYADQISRNVRQRSDAIDQGDIKSSLEKAAASLLHHTPEFLSAIRSKNSSGIHRHVSGIGEAVGEIDRAFKIAPEFAVLFDVDYIDTELAAKLAALAASVKAADPINVAKHGKAVTAEVDKQVRVASAANKSPEVLEKCNQASELSALVLKTANHALATRQETKSPLSPPYVAAESQLNAVSARLQKAVAALPVNQHKKSPTHLIKAAQELSAKLHQLLV